MRLGDHMVRPMRQGIGPAGYNEEQRTNISLALSGYAATAGTLTPNAGIAPDGSNTMSHFGEDNTTAVHYLNEAGVVAPTGAMCALSVYAKAAERQYLQLFADDGSNGGQATFDLLGGAITGPLMARAAGTIGQAAIAPAGNGVWRCSIAVSAGPASFITRIGMCLTGGQSNPGFAPSYAGTTGFGVLLWQPQMEQGAYASSYIPGPPPVTRAGYMARPPDLGQALRVAGLAGFGSGASAGVTHQGQDADQVQGLVTIYTGTTAPAGSGAIQLSCPAGVVAGQYVLLADWASWTYTVATPLLQGNWTANRPLLAGEVLTMAYQWSVAD
jgi:hypothetical protein